MTRNRLSYPTGPQYPIACTVHAVNEPDDEARPPARARRIAVIGCRPPRNPTAEEAERYRAIEADVAAFVRALPLDVVVVTGDADGVDKLAGRTAEARGMFVVHCPIATAAWRRHGTRAGPLRNALIADIADEAHAWPAPWGRGTQGCVALFRRAGKQAAVHAT